MLETWPPLLQKRHELHMLCPSGISPSDSLQSEACALPVSVPGSSSVLYSGSGTYRNQNAMSHPWNSALQVHQQIQPPKIPRLLPPQIEHTKSTPFAKQSYLSLTDSGYTGMFLSAEVWAPLGSATSRQSSEAFISPTKFEPNLGFSRWAQSVQNLQQLSSPDCHEKSSEEIRLFPNSLLGSDSQLRRQNGPESSTREYSLSQQSQFVPVLEERSASNNVTPIWNPDFQISNIRKRKAEDLERMESAVGKKFSFQNQSAHRPNPEPSIQSSLAIIPIQGHASGILKCQVPQWNKECPINAGLPSTLAFKPKGLKEMWGNGTQSMEQTQIRAPSTPGFLQKRPKMDRISPYFTSANILPSPLEKTLGNNLFCQDPLLLWGLSLRCSPGTVDLARHLCKRINFKVQSKSVEKMEWNQIVTTVGCLWISAKLSERRHTLPTVSQLAKMISLQTRQNVPGYLLVSFEISIMQKLDWQPLQGRM